MHRWVLRIAFFGLAAWLVFAAWAQRELAQAVPPPESSGPPKQALVLYQDDPSTGTDLYATLTANLVGRFGRAAVRSLDGYRAGDMASFDAVFVVPSENGARPPEALLSDVRAADRPIVWIHRGIEALFEDPVFAAGQGWRPGAPRAADYVSVRYKGRNFPRDLRTDVLVAEPEVSDPARARVLAAAIGPGGRDVPWALRSGNLFYVVEAPYAYAHEDDRYLVFADLLFDVFAPETAERHRAMVRIEDVGPEADPRRIRAVADLLAAEGVPFAITVYDTYRDPEGHYTGGRPLRISLRQRPRLVRALEYAVARGATLIAHGHTHQTDHRRNPYARVSGGDYEFFAADLRDGAFDLQGPLPGNSVEQWRERFAASRRAWRRAGLRHPRIFTTPHYAASPEAYAAAREIYAARYERALYFAGESNSGRALYDEGWETQYFPFEVVDVRGDFILPENLGYSSSTQQGGYFGRGPERLIASAERNLAVRDGFASFFHHWYEDPGALRRIVRGIKDLGYRFVGPADVVR
ncbi:MAG: DUF2334 domain-containing protein, partial [Pseudomonadota bacterium]|nr:DUF2334 domain-containing protein [Pseudomonadota bacterium]